MAVFALPYHTGTRELTLADKHVKDVLTSRIHALTPEKPETELIREALAHPIGSPRLEELARGKKSMVIITSDHTRPVPSRITLPLLLAAARKGNPEIAITIAVASGSHRDTTRAEMIAKFGEELVNREKFLMHNARDASQMVSLGVLDTGLNAEVNRAIVETDLLIAEGFIEPHFFAGFSGGRKSVFPGMASMECIRANHCASYIAHEKARTGVLAGNPIHEEAVALARLSGLRYILNVVLDGRHKVVKAFAGDFDKAHIAGCSFVSALSMVEAGEADIVVTTNGGYPLDQNIYQAVKGMTAAETACRKGGVIIMLASCCDGHGGDSFYETFAKAGSPDDVAASISGVGRRDTKLDQWQSQILARVLQKCTVILVTDQCDRALVEAFMLKHASGVDEAMATARALTSPDASVTVIPDGVSVIVRPK